MIRILTADDHDIVRLGFRRLFESTGLYEVVGDACTGEEAVSLSKALSPDIVVLDIIMPGLGVTDVIHRIKKSLPSTSILSVSLYDHPNLAERCFKAGACGYVTKSSPSAVLLKGLESVAKNRLFISPDIAEVIAINRLNTNSSSLISTLSAREFDVFLRIAQGQSIAKIADEMHLSRKTASNYSSKIKSKLNVTTSGELVHLAIRENII